MLSRTGRRSRLSRSGRSAVSIALLHIHAQHHALAFRSNLIASSLNIYRRPPLDPGLEFARIRQSLSLLESHVYQQSPGAAAAAPRGPSGGNSAHGYAPEALRRASYNASPQGPYERQGSDGGGDVKEKCEVPDIPSTPGMLGEQASDGLYAGPTSAASHLIPVSSTSERVLGSGSHGLPFGTGLGTRRQP